MAVVIVLTMLALGLLVARLRPWAMQHGLPIESRGDIPAGSQRTVR